MNKNLYYDGNRTLTYNALFNFVIGNRGCGKSYWCKKRAIKNFIKNGKKFIYLRRYETELSETAENYFNDILYNKEFDNIDIKFNANEYYINDELAGYAMCLTHAKNYKSISFPDVDFIIFEEFLLIETGYNRYLKNEVETFLNFYMSIDRYRGTTVFFLANSDSFINPYTVYFDLKKPKNTNIYKKGECLLEVVENEDYKNEVKKTRFGKLIENTAFADYAIENKFEDYNDKFISQKSAKTFYLFTIIYKNVSYGIWRDYINYRYIISKDIDETCKIVYALKISDHTENTNLIKNMKSSTLLKNLINAYKNGAVYFEDMKIRNEIYEIFRAFLF